MKHTLLVIAASLMTPLPIAFAQVSQKPDLPNVVVILADDLGEQNNLYAQQPERVTEMMSLLERLVMEGRSTLGAQQANDVPVLWRRFMD